MDITSDSGDQLGFVVLHKDNVIEIVDAISGEHIRIKLGNGEEDTSVNPLEQQQLAEALMQVALLESKALSVSIAEIVAYLQKKEHLAALGTFQGLESRFKFLGAVLEATARLPGNRSTLTTE